MSWRRPGPHSRGKNPRPAPVRHALAMSLAPAEAAPGNTAVPGSSARRVSSRRFGEGCRRNGGNWRRQAENNPVRRLRDRYADLSNDHAVFHPTRGSRTGMRKLFFQAGKTATRHPKDATLLRTSRHERILRFPGWDRNRARATHSALNNTHPERPRPRRASAPGPQSYPRDARFRPQPRSWSRRTGRKARWRQKASGRCPD